MRRFLAPLAALLLLLAIVPAALAADGEAIHTGRVLISAGGDITLPAGDEADALVVMNGTATVEGTANLVLVIDGTATVRGATLENLVVIRGDASLDGSTKVLKDVRTFDATVTQAPGTQVGGTVGGLETDVVGFAWFLAAAAIVFWIGTAIVTLLVALLLAALAAKQVRAAGSLISREPGKTALIGFLSLFVIPILAVLLMVTIVGIPAGIALLLFVWPVLAFIGYLVAAIWIGEFLVGRSSPGAERQRPYLAAVVGVVVAAILGFVPLLTFVISLFGLGAVVLAGWRVFRGTGLREPMLPQPAAPAAGA
jgi:hypothetical protein